MIELADVVAAIQDVVGAVTGIRYAPDGVPDSLPSLPASVVYPRDGVWTAGYMLGGGEHNIVIEIHLSNKTLERDSVKAYPYWSAIPQAIMTDPSINGVMEFPKRISYTFGPMNYAGTDTIGWRFVLEQVKIYPNKK